MSDHPQDVSKTVWNCMDCYPNLCRCEDRDNGSDEAEKVAAPGAADQGGFNKRDPFSTAALLINEWNETPQDVDEWGNRAAEALGYLAQELHKEIVTRCAVANREKENG